MVVAVMQLAVSTRSHVLPPAVECYARTKDSPRVGGVDAEVCDGIARELVLLPQ